jgi:hypothetical protein
MTRIRWAHVCTHCGGWVTAGAPHGCPARPAFAHWPAGNTEASVAAMQAEGPNPDHQAGHRAYGEYLAIINPETPRRD